MKNRFDKNFAQQQFLMSQFFCDYWKGWFVSYLITFTFFTFNYISNWLLQVYDIFPHNLSVLIIMKRYIVLFKIYLWHLDNLTYKLSNRMKIIFASTICSLKFSCIFLWLHFYFLYYMYLQVFHIVILLTSKYTT